MVWPRSIQKVDDSFFDGALQTRSAGQTALAYVTAATHGLEEEAARLAEELEEVCIHVPEPSKSPDIIPDPSVHHFCRSHGPHRDG